jgi:hypothetical protein
VAIYATTVPIQDFWLLKLKDELLIIQIGNTMINFPLLHMKAHYKAHKKTTATLSRKRENKARML